MSFKTDQPAYRALRNIIAERTSPIVYWVGAGLSAEAGLPTWTQLRDSLCDTLETKARTFSESERELDPRAGLRDVSPFEQVVYLSRMFFDAEFFILSAKQRTPQM